MKTSSTSRKRISNENISVPVFKNRFLDRLTRAPFYVPITFLIIFTSSLIYWNVSNSYVSFGEAIPLFVGGWLLFTLVEYLMHRFLYHISAPTEKREKFQYTIHGVHHEYPKDKLRLAMPPVPMMMLAALFLSVFYLILNTMAFVTFAGFTIGYILYLFTHYSVHVMNPPKNFFKILWINHAIHHYSQEDYCFGVSSPLWDYVFGTYPKKKVLKSMSVDSITEENL